MNPYDDNEPDLHRLRRDPEGRQRETYYADRQAPDHYDAPPTPAPHEHHELTLSAGAILGLFFGLVILCGLFFGLGYNMHGHAPAPIVGGTSASTSPATNFSAFKPAAGVAANTAGARASTVSPAVTSSANTITPSQHAADAAIAPVATIVRSTPGVVPPVALPAGAYLVQVAAISMQHKPDADLLLTALKNKGYTAFARPDSDNLLHVQVGPFSTRTAAEEARQRLLADGYSPYIK